MVSNLSFNWVSLCSNPQSCLFPDKFQFIVSAVNLTFSSTCCHSIWRGVEEKYFFLSVHTSVGFFSKFLSIFSVLVRLFDISL